MQPNPETKTISEKKPAERRTIEVIVGRKPDPGEAVPQKIRKLGEELIESELGGRSAPVYVQSPYTGIVYLVKLDYAGEWFTEPTGQSFHAGG